MDERKRFRTPYSQLSDHEKEALNARRKTGQRSSSLYPVYIQDGTSSTAPPQTTAASKVHIIQQNNHQDQAFRASTLDPGTSQPDIQQDLCTISYLLNVVI